MEIKRKQENVVLMTSLNPAQPCDIKILENIKSRLNVLTQEIHPSCWHRGRL